MRKRNSRYPLPNGERGGVRGRSVKRNNVDICRKLRKNETDAEHKLWHLLRSRQLNGVKFRRQFPVESYILDFYVPELRLCIEVDGGQHYEDEGRKRDELRTEELRKEGIRVLRFSDRDVLGDIEGVYEVIRNTVENIKH